MKDLDAYFAYLDGLIRTSGAVEERVHYRLLSSTQAEVWGTLIFADGSSLEFYEKVVHTGKQISRQRYRYHYMRGKKMVFRYDTAPHYPRLSTFPYHKHDAQGRVLESPPVSLKEVLAEITRLLEGGGEKA